MDGSSDNMHHLSKDQIHGPTHVFAVDSEQASRAVSGY